jgi:hypothetical protein
METRFHERIESWRDLPVTRLSCADNTGSIAFHRRLGFDAKIVDGYNSPGQAMVVFHRVLPLDAMQP